VAIEIRLRIFKDPVSASTHFAGFLAALVGGAILTLGAWPEGGVKTVGMAIYAMGLTGVFFASSMYHFFDFGERWNDRFCRLDHAAIFLMIAGSYVPPVLHLLDGWWRIGMLVAVGLIAAFGVVIKTWGQVLPTWVSTGIYLGMGWLFIVPAHLMLPQLDWVATTWLVVGGAAYTVGAIVYASERPDPFPNVFGHHELWHLFVLAGAGAHYAFMWTLLDRPVPAF
jgi:hemolysin III